MYQQVCKIGEWIALIDVDRAYMGYTVINSRREYSVFVDHVMKAVSGGRTLFKAPAELWQALANDVWQRLEAKTFEGVKVTDTCWLVKDGYWYLLKDGDGYRVEPCEHDQPSHIMHKAIMARWFENALQSDDPMAYVSPAIIHTQIGFYMVAQYIVSQKASNVNQEES